MGRLGLQPGYFKQQEQDKRIRIHLKKTDPDPFNFPCPGHRSLKGVVGIHGPGAAPFREKLWMIWLCNTRTV